MGFIRSNVLNTNYGGFYEKTFCITVSIFRFSDMFVGRICSEPYISSTGDQAELGEFLPATRTA
jgi:hypothetical protein